MKVYISGAITGVDNYLDNFNNAELYLKTKGFDVINPAKTNDILPASFTYEQYMAVDLAMLDAANTIYMLKGWENSRGANREYGYALGKGYKVIFQMEEE